MERVMAAVQAAGGEISCVKPHKSKVKCSIFKDFTMVNFHITVYRNISQNPTAPYILEFQKRGGDSFTWNSVCTTLLESLRDLSATRIPVANIEAEAKQLRIIDGIHPQELAALAAGMVSIEGGHQETHCIAARAYGVAAATLEARRLAGKGEAGEHIWGNESAAAKKHRIEDSLQALRDVKDESGEIARCVQSTLSSLNRQTDTAPRPVMDANSSFHPRQPWNNTSNLDAWCRSPETVMILSSSA